MRNLELLEERIDTLLVRAAALNDENKNLKEAQSGHIFLAEENRKLRFALKEERAKSEAALYRIDTLLQKLKMDGGEA